MSTVAKSFRTGADAIIAYCAEHTVKQEEIQKELLHKTLEHAANPFMIGAPEVLQFGQNFIQLIHAKRVLDIVEACKKVAGTFTGASALAWALVLPDDGQVISMDVSHEQLNKVGLPVLNKRPDLLKKIDFRLGSALEILDSLIEKGETSKFDFAFIDADKENISSYYERAITLLRPGGVIFIDNALWSGKVVNPQADSDRAVAAVNKLAFEDPRTNNALLNLGDGTHVVFKK